MSEQPTISIVHKCDNPRRVVFAPHNDTLDKPADYPEPDHECLPCIGFPVKFRKKDPDYDGRCEEVIDDHIITSGDLLFRFQKTGFVLCLN